jgi:hypothetical protein
VISTLARPVPLPRQPRPLPRDASFAVFVRNRRPQLLRCALLLCAADPERAETALRRALTRSYVAWPRIGPEDALAFAHRALVEAAAEARPGATGTAPPDRVLRALGELPPGMRAAVVLRCVEGLGTAQTADALGCARGTAAGQVALGLARLRTAVEGRAAATGPLPPRRPFADVAELVRTTARRLPVPVLPPGTAAADDVRRGRTALARARRRGAHR